jgi:hypothetical protein
MTSEKKAAVVRRLRADVERRTREAAAWQEAEDKKLAEIERSGFEAGRKWAEETATVQELERLPDALKAIESLYDPHMHAACAIGGRAVATRQDGDDRGYWNASDRFWLSVGVNPSDAESPFCDGFVKGAVEVWQSVKAEL